MGDRKRQKRADIQALRAIAVLSVVIYHLWPNRLVGGFMGVDIFFVISGYLMTITLMRDAESVTLAKDKVRSGWHYLVNFYARRIKRLVPAASVTLLGTLGLTLLTGNYVTIIETSKQIFSSALFFQNWQLAANSVDYLAATDPPTAVQHFWSLSLEEQFYFVWPLLLLVLLLLTINLTVVYKKSKALGAILPTAILVAIFFVYGYRLTKNDAPVAYFDTFARVWELLLGGAIAFLPKLRNYDLKLLLPWAGFAMNIFALSAWNGDNFPGWHALVPVIGTALIIYAGTSSPDSQLSFSNAFRYKPIQWVGDISYSLYLWHWPFIILLPLLIGLDIDGSKGNALKLVILLVSFIIASLSFKFVEIPTQKLRIKKYQVYVGFVLIVGIVAGSAYFIRQSTEAKAESELTVVHSLVKSDSNDKCIGAKWEVHKDVCKNGFGKVNSSFAQFTSVDHYSQLVDGDKCGFYDYRTSKKDRDNPENSCIIGDQTSDYQIAVFGDSHTSHWVNALNDIGKRNGVKFIALDSRKCGSDEVLQPQCEERRNFLKKSKVLDKSRYVLISALHRSATTLDNKFGNLEMTFKALRSITKTPIYLLEDIPHASKFIGANCIIYRSSCDRKTAIAIESIKTVSNNAIKAGIVKKDHIIPTYDMFCNDKHCFSLIGGLSVYYNQGKGPDITNSHMTASFSLSLALPLEKKLRAYGLLPQE